MLQWLCAFLAPCFLLLTQTDIDAHIAALKAEDKEGRIKAAKALAKMGPDAEPAIPALVACLNDARPENYDVRVATLCGRALVAIGKPAVPPILKALKSDDVLTFTGAAEAIMFMKTPPDAALDTLFKALEDRSKGGNPGLKPRQRAWVAARVLAKYGPKARPATGDLIEMLHSKNFHEQVAACQALASIGSTAVTAVPKLMDLVTEGVASVRGHAAMALASIGPVEGQDIVAPIVEATKDFSSIVRARALMSLGVLGPEAKSALPQLLEFLRNENYRNRTETAYAVWRITGDPKEPVEVLSELAANLDYELDALAILGKMGPAAAEAAPVLLGMLDAKDPDKRFELVQTLQRIAPGADKVKAALQKLAQSDPDPDVRRVAGRKIQDK